MMFIKYFLLIISDANIIEIKFKKNWILTNMDRTLIFYILQCFFDDLKLVAIFEA
jgi:hypothetical protein